MKTAINWENYEFFSLKHVEGLMALENLTGTQKLWAITRENGHKHEND